MGLRETTQVVFVRGTLLQSGSPLMASAMSRKSRTFGSPVRDTRKDEGRAPAMRNRACTEFEAITSVYIPQSAT